LVMRGSHEPRNRSSALQTTTIFALHEASSLVGLEQILLGGERSDFVDGTNWFTAIPGMFSFETKILNLCLRCPIICSDEQP